MKTVTRETWLEALRELDFVLVRGDTFFGRAQDLDRRAEGAADKRASHSAILKKPPLLSEADGKIVNGKNAISRYFTGHHRIWIFRYTALSPEQAAAMRAYIRGAEETRGTYAWGGILEFAKRTWAKLWGRAYAMKDRPGVFCSEYTSRLAQTARLVYLEKPPHQVSPSLQLDWLLDTGVKQGTWEWVAYFDEGDFYLL